MTTFKNYLYDKHNVRFNILSSGVSKTNIKRFIARIPVRYFKGINKLYFVKTTDEEMHDFIAAHHHTGETKFNRSYHGIIFEGDDDKINIAVYMTNDFYRELNKKSVWVSSIRMIILHELGHFLVWKHGFGSTYNEKDNEDLADRFVERNSNMRFMMFSSPSKIREFYEIWDRIESKCRLKNE